MSHKEARLRERRRKIAYTVIEYTHDFTMKREEFCHSKILKQDSNETQ